ncbi:MAG: protein phosphatase 2C domain-containing protein [Chromatiales bacterium]|nr:serine/threonine-protein phosphatase [Gammaproteobacteria bacterium]MBW6476976.1 protein phosphatase 2C domain-containing protein [Chromatiales bacterium]
MRYEIGQVNRLGNRSSNQDRFLAVETDEGVLLALGDGMGGQAQGEVAAEILVEVARRCYLETQRPIPEVGSFLREVMLQAHQAINAFGRRQQPPTTPGTTGVLCLIQQDQAVWAHVGDSRLYLYQQGLPIYRTTDHSYVEQLFQKGEISRWEQDLHPRRNQITQCLGARHDKPEVSISKPVSLKPEDIILICSDGLWGPLDDAVMGRMLLADNALEDSLDKMAESAEHNSYPHSDNISAMALRFIASGTALLPGQSKQQARTVAAGGDQLESAIAQIEQVLKEYEKEFKS